MALKTWKKFLEGKGCDPHTLKTAAALEREEEKQGKDLDDDDEEGESTGHTKKVTDDEDGDENNMKSIFAKAKKSKK